MYGRDDASAMAWDDGERHSATVLFGGGRGGKVVDAEDVVGGATKHQ